MTQSQIEAFRIRVADCLAPAPPVVAAEAAVAEVVDAMRRAATSSVLVRDGEGGALIGIVTEQDVTRRLAFRTAPADVVRTVMTSPVEVVRADDLLFHAIARMRRAGLRHMPVVDTRDAPVGILHLDAALAAVLPQLMDQIDRLTRSDTLDGLRETRAAQIDVAADLMADGVATPDIQVLLTDINLNVYRRAAELCEAALSAEGKGGPPRPYCLLVLGSGGRGENYLNPDQDNGLIVADYPDDDHNRVDGYFRDFAERLTKMMDGVGMPLCKGNVMATNPVWRKTASQWRAQLDYWLRKRNLVTLRLFDIFFDFRAVHGAHHLAAELRDDFAERLRGNRPFIRAVYEKDEEFGVALGLFNRLLVERHVEAHKGKLNLKLNGTLPLVDAVRALALLHGVKATPTLARIAALQDLDILDHDEADYLAGAFRHLTALILRSQMTEQRAGRPVSNYVDPRGLTERERDMLVDSLKAIRDLRGRIHVELTGDIF
jgi:signal-transduction protein with cAMP-binding, CBS, and nucleotidyltransferase domain